MHTIHIFMTTLCVIGFASTAAIAGDSSKKLIKEVSAIGDAVAEAMIEGDVEVMLGFYAEDAISLPNYSPRMEGIETFRKAHDEMGASGMKILSFTNETTEAWGCGSQVTEIGTFTIEIQIPGMDHLIKDEGKFMTIWERDSSGTLKVKAEIWNSDHDPMAAISSDHQ